MSFYCTCGRGIDTVEWPSRHKASLIADVAKDNHTDYTVSGGGTLINGSVPMRHVYECPRCGRLHVEKKPRSNEYASFIPEGNPIKFFEDEP